MLCCCLCSPAWILFRKFLPYCFGTTVFSALVLANSATKESPAWIEAAAQSRQVFEERERVCQLSTSQPLFAPTLALSHTRHFGIIGVRNKSTQGTCSKRNKERRMCFLNSTRQHAGFIFLALEMFCFLAMVQHPHHDDTSNGQFLSMGTESAYINLKHLTENNAIKQTSVQNIAI